MSIDPSAAEYAGLIVAKIEDTPDAALIIRDGNTEQQIILL